MTRGRFVMRRPCVMRRPVIVARRLPSLRLSGPCSGSLLLLLLLLSSSSVGVGVGEEIEHFVEDGLEVVGGRVRGKNELVEGGQEFGVVVEIDVGDVGVVAFLPGAEVGREGVGQDAGGDDGLLTVGNGGADLGDRGR